ncbi:MAG: hypothetical protein HXY34_00300 [Candidatus Thorarchaeota archaeon]|nr:hypothetical protein [Candidatus Thorarchaeota archaeon]
MRAVGERLNAPLSLAMRLTPLVLAPYHWRVGDSSLEVESFFWTYSTDRAFSFGIDTVIGLELAIVLAPFIYFAWWIQSEEREASCVRLAVATVSVSALSLYTMVCLITYFEWFPGYDMGLSVSSPLSGAFVIATLYIVLPPVMRERFAADNHACGVLGAEHVTGRVHGVYWWVLLLIITFLPRQISYMRFTLEGSLTATRTDTLNHPLWTIVTELRMYEGHYSSGDMSFWIGLWFPVGRATSGLLLLTLTGLLLFAITRPPSSRHYRAFVYVSLLLNLVEPALTTVTGISYLLRHTGLVMPLPFLPVAGFYHYRCRSAECRRHTETPPVEQTDIRDAFRSWPEVESKPAAESGFTTVRVPMLYVLRSRLIQATRARRRRRKQDVVT